MLVLLPVHELIKSGIFFDLINIAIIFTRSLTKVKSLVSCPVPVMDNILFFKAWSINLGITFLNL